MPRPIAMLYHESTIPSEKAMILFTYLAHCTVRQRGESLSTGSRRLNPIMRHPNQPARQLFHPPPQKIILAS